MLQGIGTIGAPDSTVINEEFTLLCVTLLQQSDEVPGSEMLLNVKVSIGGLDHVFLVGGYWSNKGFRLTTMLAVGRTLSPEGDGTRNAKPKLYGLAFATPTAVMMDRVQQCINSQDVGRPAEPLHVCMRKDIDDGSTDEEPKG